MKTATIGAGDDYVLFNSEVKRWLGVWMDTNLTFEEHHNSCMKKAKTAKAKHRMLTKTYGVISDSIRAVQIVCVQVVALYESELRSDPQEVGR